MKHPIAIRTYTKKVSSDGLIFWYGGNCYYSGCVRKSIRRDRMAVQIKRIYEKVTEDDGVRVLVDRVWPRGVSKEKAQLDHWMKEVAPSNELRKWFGHDPEKYETFKKRYKEELKSGDQAEQLAELKQLTKAHDKHILLLYAAKDEEHNQAKVLKEILDHQ